MGRRGKLRSGLGATAAAVAAGALHPGAPGGFRAGVQPDLRDLSVTLFPLRDDA